MKMGKKIMISSLSFLILYGGFYLYNVTAEPKTVYVKTKYISTESVEELESEAELIVKATKISENNEVSKLTDSGDSSISYEEPFTIGTFSIDKIYFDKTSQYKNEDEFQLKEFSGYTINKLTGVKTYIAPEDYQATEVGKSYLLFVRESMSDPGRYIIFAHHYGKYGIDSEDSMEIANKLDDKTSSKYKKIEKEIKEKYK
ncbi:hypothetical protein KDN24_18925 [Bacillus sp. Bva_UNVM-123]|uniref:hypothetical protein n=1 Tax=Bacillus sp. Bva_UNVM-123 TaxID=2829798 RepID=UPI00391FC539